MDARKSAKIISDRIKKDSPNVTIGGATVSRDGNIHVNGKSAPLGGMTDGDQGVIIEDANGNKVGFAPQSVLLPATEQRRSQFRRQKRPKQTSYYPKVLSYIEEGDNYNFYLWGDRTPQLIYSIPNTSVIEWGDITTNSQNKNDWQVGILYYDESIQLILDEQYWIGDLDWLATEDPPGLFETGGYKLAIINSTGVTTYDTSQYGWMLKYIESSGNGTYGFYDIYQAFQYYNGLNDYPFLNAIDYNVIETNYATNDRQPSDPNPFPLTLYSANFAGASKYTILSDVVNPVNSSTIPQISNIADTDTNFFNELGDFNNWISPTFITEDPNLDLFSTYTLNQVDIGLDPENYPWQSDKHIQNVNETGLVPWLFASTRGLGDDDYSRSYNYTWIDYPNASSWSDTNYDARHSKASWFYPPNTSYSLFNLSGNSANQISSVRQSYETSIFESHGQSLVISQTQLNATLKIPIIQKDSVIVNTINFSFNDINCIGNTSSFYFNTIDVNATGDRRTDIKRFSTNNQTINLIATTQDFDYQYFYFRENGEPIETGSRLEYNIPTVKYYDSSNNTAVIGIRDMININESLTSGLNYKYWNGSQLVDTSIPSDTSYYLEMKNNKFVGILKNDIDSKTKFDIYEWEHNETALPAPKKTKVKLKGTPTGHTILDASFGK